MSVKSGEPSGEVQYRSHPPGWNSKAHYGMCGQSCPCCRFYVEYLIHRSQLGVCDVCVYNSQMEQKQRKRSYEEMKNSDESFTYSLRKRK